MEKPIPKYVFLMSGPFLLIQNRLKNPVKNEMQIEGVLMLIIYQFLSILGAKLGSKINETSIQNVLKKVMEKGLRRRWVKNQNRETEGCGK